MKPLDQSLEGRELAPLVGRRVVDAGLNDEMAPTLRFDDGTELTFSVEWYGGEAEVRVDVRGPP